MNSKYKPGLRAIKTALAVFFCLLISIIFKREDFFSSIAAIICMQQTYDQTFKSGLNRLVGTMLGGAVGYIILQAARFLPYINILNLLIFPLCILLVIYLCNVVKKKDSVVIACIVLLTVISPLERSNSDTLIYVIDRVIDTATGVIVAMLVNRFFFPRRIEKIRKKQKEE